jgi:MoxR-like ATPase
MLDEARCRFYAAERWVNTVYAVTSSPEDPKTFYQWGRLVGASRSTLATWCRGAGVSPRRSLQLARLLRALVLTDGRLTLLQQVLDIAEPRTLQRLLERAGLRPDENQVPAMDFLARQRLVNHPVAINQLTSLLLQRTDRTVDSAAAQRF